MNKILTLGFAVLVCASVAMAQTYTQGSGITGIDKLGPHQNGGRGCAGCHAPHSGVRGNGGALTGSSVLQANTPNAQGQIVGPAQVWTAQTADTSSNTNAYGDMALWGQDIGPIIGLGTITTGDSFQVNLATPYATSPSITTGIIFCLSCHDGNVAKGAMMTNQSFEQAAGLLPNTYGSQPIPTLLGNDGGPTNNYQNDHPVGPNASLSRLSYLAGIVTTNSTNTKVILTGSTSTSVAGVDPTYGSFMKNYGAPQIGSWAVDPGTTSTTVGTAYVVCTTCHTPHSMYTYTGASAGNPIAGNGASGQVYPSYFFINAPYNPGANIANGTKASSATQFCRQCHFSGAGGSNEYAGITGIATAF